MPPRQSSTPVCRAASPENCREEVPGQEALADFVQRQHRDLRLRWAHRCGGLAGLGAFSLIPAIGGGVNPAS